ncbi:MAG: hypothetical protein ABIR28_13450 [Vicinamibacteria bacterium]
MGPLDAFESVGVACFIKMTTAPRDLFLFCVLAAFGSGCTTGTASTVPVSQSSTGVPALTDTVFLSSDVWQTTPIGLFELYGVGGSSTPTRLTFCTNCQALSATPSLDRNRVALRRVVADTNRDGKLDEFDTTSLILVDLARKIEGPFLPDGWTTSSADWSSDGTFLIHTSSPNGGAEDLYQIDANAQNNSALIATPTVRERNGRVDTAISRIVYERIDGTGVGKAEIWIWLSSTNQVKITDGGTVGAALANSYYLVGSDANPDYSPDGTNIVFRRLTSNAVNRGAWDIMTVPGVGGAAKVLVSGSQYRSAPDWSKDGIVFAEGNLTTGGIDVVVVDPTTGGRRVIQSLGRGYSAISPRWINGISK